MGFSAILLLMLSACTSQGNQPELSSPTQVTSTATPQISVTPSPTPIPLGTEGNPVTMGLIWSDEGEQSPAAAKFIQYLADSTGFVFALLPFDNTLDLITAMDQGAVSFAWLQPEAYLYASENNIASVAYITSHYGLYAYGSSVYVREGSGFQLNFDSDTGTSKLTASAALRQFSQKVPSLSINTPFLVMLTLSGCWQLTTFRLNLQYSFKRTKQSSVPFTLEVFAISASPTEYPEIPARLLPFKPNYRM